ncbi:MAG: TonB-dependent receptor [Bacteroides sp.]
MRRFLIGIILVGICVSGYALPEMLGVVKGKVIDAKTKVALDYVNVSVTKKGSTELIKGTITDQTGSFFLDNIPYGSYTVSISYIGYKTLEKGITLTSTAKFANMHVVSLSEDSQVLDEVQVLGQKSQMKFEIDKKVFDVDQNISSTGGSASDVLSNIPSVEVDNEGEVSLRGSSNVTVWINGKASGLSADNRAQILEQMPAESIEKIEVITNPSAKYSPEGTAGIINIVLKRDRKAGYYGSVQAGADTRGGYNGSANINYSSGKLDAYASLGYRNRKREGGGYTNRLNTNDNTFLNQTSENDGRGGNAFGRFGLTYHATDNDHFLLNGFGMFGDRKNKNTIDYTSDNPHSFVSSQRLSDSDNSMNGGNVEIGYKREFSKNSNLDFTASYNSWNMDNTSIYNQHSEYVGKRISSYQRQENSIRNHNWELQLDYLNKFNENNKLEAGYKGTLSRENSPVETFSGATVSTIKEDKELYNKFLYDQDIHALYATYSGRVKKFGYQLGLRGEYSKVDTKSYGYGQTDADVTPFKKDYFSLFPSAFFSYSLPNENEIQANYTRRISRPWGNRLNPFMNITDSTNISYGNPELMPQYSNAYELNYIKNWANHTLSVSAYYRTTDDVIQRIRYLDGNVMKSTSENVAKTQSAGLELVGKNKLFRILDLTTTVNLFYYKLDGFTYFPTGATEPVIGNPDEDFSWNARMIANVILPYSISFQLTGNYNAKQVVAQGYRKANYSVDAGIRKSFMNKKLSLSVNARDLLDSRKWHTYTFGTGFEQNSKSWRGGRQFGFTLTYSFGNMRAKSNKSNKEEKEGSNMIDSIDAEY